MFSIKIKGHNRSESQFKGLKKTLRSETVREVKVEPHTHTRNTHTHTHTHAHTDTGGTTCFSGAVVMRGSLPRDSVSLQCTVESLNMESSTK